MRGWGRRVGGAERRALAFVRKQLMSLSIILRMVRRIDHHQFCPSHDAEKLIDTNANPPRPWMGDTTKRRGDGGVG